MCDRSEHNPDGVSGLQQRRGDLGVDRIRQRNILPIRINHSPRIGDYNVSIRLNGEINWTTHQFRITDASEFVISEGDDEIVNMEFDEDGFDLGIDTEAISARFDEEGVSEASGEFGPVTVEFDFREREATLTLDALGLTPAWRRLQEMMGEIGDVTADFTLLVRFPEEGEVWLRSISADLGISLGPEQARISAELNITTTYTGPNQRGANTTASDSVVAEIDILGFQREITLHESAASSHDLGNTYTTVLVELGLRYAMHQLYLLQRRMVDDPDAYPIVTRPDLLRSYFKCGFNEYYSHGYDLYRNRVIQHYRDEWELEENEEILMPPISSIQPISHWIERDGIFRMVMDSYYWPILSTIIIPRLERRGINNQQEMEAIWSFWDQLVNRDRSRD